MSTAMPSEVSAAGFARVGPSPSWDHIFTGTRSESMGQADLAVSQGPMSIFENPAPLHEGEGVQVGYGNMVYVMDLEFHQYAAAVEWGAFRLGMARMDFVSDSLPVRTAYQPEGNGETHRLDDRVRVISGAVDVAWLLAPGSPWEWTVGVAHRGYRFGAQSEVIHANGLDFGSSGRYRHRFDGFRLVASAAGVLRNIEDSDYHPEGTRLGLGLSLAVDDAEKREMIVLTLGYVFKDVRTEEKYFGDRHYGAELTLLRSLSFRLGRDKQIFGGTSQYGLGLTLPHDWLHPFGVTLDWSSQDSGLIRELGISDQESFESFSLTVRRSI